MIVLALLALTSGMLIATEYHATQTDAERIDYRIEPQAEGCETADADRVSEFDELSPDAQEVFLSTLRSDGEYTTTESPDQFRISSDNDVENYVVYESDCYSLVGYGAGLGTRIYLYVLLLFGIPFTLALAVLAVYSYRADSFRLPATIVAAVGVGAVSTAATANVVGGVATAIGVFVVGLAWTGLGSFDPLNSEGG
ncbi:MULTISPECIES: hypothetical protein [Halorubrum]|uniref:DUF7979 domain-containing protein n=1 Tax=Halorubrum hochstenium ATCC 700873 TaxID=1227481 RepID=M0FDY2_9EURY|nr:MULTISPECIES: hypothetical protein [Halorubrum]ELZ56834.1 hypothetical protein C467_07407 [Halorubrum hochstenium ATCC 700873]